MLVKVKDHNFLVKDNNSKAILNNDVAALREFKNRKNFFKSLSERMEKLEHELLRVNQQINELKNLR